MSTTELRQKLIDTIKTTNDQSLLEEAGRLFDVSDNSEESYHLSVEQIFAINEARQQIKDGKTISNDEVNNQIDEWLNK